MEMNASLWNERKRRTDRWVGLLIFLGALAVYAATVCRGAFPGASADMLAAHAGLEPLARPVAPLWSLLVRGMAAVGGAGMALRVHFLQALMGALAVAGMYHCVSWLVFRTIAWQQENTPGRARVAAVLAGLTAALSLAFSMPFWMVATRAYPHVLAVLMLVVAARLLQRYADSGRLALAWAFALVYGAGLAESSAFWTLGPVFLVFLLLILSAQERLRAPIFLSMAAAGAIGSCMFFVAALRFYGSEGFHLAGFGGFLQIIRIMLVTHIQAIRGGLPRVGWLVVVLMCIVPWLMALIIGRRALNDERDWGFYVLHVVMLGLLLMILFNMRMAPWPLLGLSAMPVMPYVLTAMVGGYLAAYACMLTTFWWSEAPPGSWRSGVRYGLGPVLAVALMLAAAVAAVLNVPAADGRQVGFIHRYVDHMIHSVDGRDWVVTDGTFDSLLRIRAHEQGLPRLRALNLARQRESMYLKRLREWFPEPWMQNAIDLGMLNFLQQYIRHQPDAAETVALAVMPDLWAGVESIHLQPHKTLFLGTREPERLDPRQILDEHRAFWDAMAPAVAPRDDALHLVAAFRRYIRRQMGMIANNLGVFLDEQGHAESAADAYRRARGIDPDNVSAMLNLVAMAQRGEPHLDAEAVARIETEGQAFFEGISQRLDIWSLSRHYGYVRDPAAFTQLGWAWALSGQPGLAVSGMRRALDIATESEREPIREALAASFLFAADEVESRRLFEEILAQNPENLRALMALARMAIRDRDLDAAREWLDRAAEAGAPAAALSQEWASWQFAAGDLDRARLILEELTQVEPQNARAWSMLSNVLGHQGDRARLRQLINEMELRFGPDDYGVLLSKGQQAFHQQQWTASRAYFLRAADRRPQAVLALEWVLRLDTLLGNAESARRHARRLLQIHPDHAAGNHILGMLSLADGRPRHAEAFLRRSLETQRTPGTLNDMAELMLRTDRIAEAESLVREALSLDDSLHVAWDTLGSVLAHRDRFEEAQHAYETAIRLYPEDLRTHLNLARMLHRAGNLDRARELVREMESLRAQLPAPEQETLRLLSAELAAP